MKTPMQKERGAKGAPVKKAHKGKHRHSSKDTGDSKKEEDSPKEGVDKASGDQTDKTMLTPAGTDGTSLTRRMLTHSTKSHETDSIEEHEADVSQKPSEKNTVTLELKGETVKVIRQPGMAVFLTRTLNVTPTSFSIIANRMHALPDHLVFVKLHQVAFPSVPDDERVAVESFPNRVYSVRVFIGFNETNISIMKTLLAAMHAGSLPSMEPEQVIVFDSIEAVKSASQHWYIRWPLYLYEQLKAAFPNPYSGSTAVDEDKIITVSINVHV